MQLFRTNGCTMGDRSVTFSDIYLAKLENEIVALLKQKYYG